MITNKFDRISFSILFLVVTFLPFFFLPFTTIPVETGKSLLLVLGLALVIIFWSLGRFSDGKINFPKSPILLSSILIVFAFFLSACFAGVSSVSFFGTMLDIGTFYFILAAFLLMFCTFVMFHDVQKAKILLFGIMFSSTLVLIFQTLRLFVPNKILSLGVFADKTGNLLGTWNALGLFAGFAGLAFILVAEFFPVTKVEKLVLRLLTLLALFVVAVVDFALVWVLLGVLALVIFVYKISLHLHENKSEGEGAHFPLFSFFVIVISLFFFIAGPRVQGYLPDHFGVSNSEVSPSFSTTMSMAKDVFIKNPILGAGPNRFSEVWAMYKPLSINMSTVNNTDLFNISFVSGSGLLPTFAVTTGSLGVLAWFIFFILFFSAGIKSIFSSIKNGNNWEIVVFFILSLYLFVALFFYSTGVVMFLLALVLSGVFFSLVSLNNVAGEFSLSFVNDHRKSFFLIFLLVVFVIASLAAAYKYTERLVSLSYFNKAAAATTIPTAEDYINQAVSLYPNDLYLRTYSQIYLIDLNSIVGKGIASLTPQDKTNLQDVFDQAQSSAQLAVTYDPQDYFNFQQLGAVYATAGALSVSGAYDQALAAYTKASLLNPLNPGLRLDLASAALSNGEPDQAKTYALSALQLKPNYIDAMLALSQIDKQEGNMTEALSYGEEALSLNPTDSNLVQYVNSLNNAASSPTITSPETSISKNTPPKVSTETKK